MSSNSKFKAIIVGGSVAGLTQAHALESAGINYVLLEARDHVAPPFDATILLMPNGIRILDQLGIYEATKPYCSEFKYSVYQKSDGTFLHKNEWPMEMKARLGYPVGIYERPKLLRSLYDQLKDKKKITVNKKVIRIENGNASVKVFCDDGTSYEGDIVIGADGVHSKIRKEMQRIGNEESPGSMDTDEESMTVQYCAWFGYSKPSPSYNLVSGSVTTSSSINRSSLLFVGKHDQPQWFFVSKLPQQLKGSIPRLTKAQSDVLAAEHAEFQFAPGVTLKKMLDTASQTSFVSLEESTFKRWTHGRIVCVGDSVHKMTPTTGQGGNQAIESVAVLTNTLVSLLSTTSGNKPSLEALLSAFNNYQEERWARVRLFVKFSGRMTRADANDNIRDTIRLLFVKPISTEQTASFQEVAFKGAPRLNHLPLPERLRGIEDWGPEEEEPKIRAKL